MNNIKYEQSFYSFSKIMHKKIVWLLKLLLSIKILNHSKILCSPCKSTFVSNRESKSKFNINATNTSQFDHDFLFVLCLGATFSVQNISRIASRWVCIFLLRPYRRNLLLLRYLLYRRWLKGLHCPLLDETFSRMVLLHCKKPISRGSFLAKS